MIDVIPSIEAHATTSIYSILPNKCTGTINEFLIKKTLITFPLVIKCGLTDSADSTDYRFFGKIAVCQSVFSISIKHRLNILICNSQTEGVW